MALRALLPLLAIAVLAAGDAPGTTRIARWRDDKACAFILMFDDGCPSDIANVVPELERRGMTGTFYLNPGAKQYRPHRDFWEGPATAKGFELANHTLTHRGGDDAAAVEHEIVACNEAIHAATPTLPWPRLISYGQPGGQAKEHWGMSPDQLAALLAREHLVARPDYRGRGAMVGPFKTAAGMLVHVDQAIAAGAMESLVFHGVGGDWIVTPMPVFRELLDGLEARRDKLWICGHIPAVQYATERDAATLGAAAVTGGSITLTLACTADPRFYDQPLTLVTVVPAGWTAVAVDQGKRHAEAAMRDGRAMYEALPGADPIVLRRK